MRWIAGSSGSSTAGRGVPRWREIKVVVQKKPGGAEAEWRIEVNAA